MDERTRESESVQPPARQVKEPRRWIGPTALTAFIVVPFAILIASNLDATEVSWAGFRFNQPLWVILFVTFLAGMLGGKVGGWAWRRLRKRRQRLKEELTILRRHAADGDSPST